MEFVGPLGVRLGMLQINADWVLLYVPREKTVLRFPTSELYKNTARRARFLRLLPIPVLPEAMFDSILTRVDLPASTKVAQLQCGFDPESQLYWMRVPSAPLANYKGGRWIWIEPHAFSPVEVQYFDAYLPEKNEVREGRPLVKVSFSKVQNPGAPAALPRRILLSAEDGKKLRFEWNRFEMIEAYNPKTFAWKPPASVEVKDY